MKKGIIVIFGFLFMLWQLSAFAAQDWQSWVKDLRQDAIAKGIDGNFFDQIFADLTPSQKIVSFDRTQPEKRITYYQYRNSRGDHSRINDGRREFRKNKTLLLQIGNEYGVDPCIITALWGLETSYGNFTGNFDVIRSLSTLAYDGRRSAFFRNELLLALKMLNDGQVTREKFKGEWAGASGQTQFLPSSWFKYAVDYDSDGIKDIWGTYGDIFASIANYLSINGWQANQPVLIEVTSPANFNSSLIGLNKTRTVADWQDMGIILHQPANKNLSASIIHPEGGPYLMVFNNFKVIMKWNYSTYYAGTVDYLAKNICSAK
jgi:membrane-bound lytic murein transglycosylase B